MNLPHAGTFSASLMIESKVPGVRPYEIPLSAHAEDVRFFFSDPSPLSFGYVPIGETEVIERLLINRSQIAASFSFSHNAKYLTCLPETGTIAPNESLRVCFVFRPMDEPLQRTTVRVVTNCCAPLFLPFHGAGGVPRIVCLEGEEVSFGRCLVGKDLVKTVTLRNIGTAAFSFQSATLVKGSIFTNTTDWPVYGEKIPPGGKFTMGVVFRPLQEDTYKDHVVIKSTSCDPMLLQVVGHGRDALLVYDKHFINFDQCIVGNTYTSELSLMNVGEVDYPIKLYFTQDTEHKILTSDLALVMPSLSVSPSILSLGAFEKRVVTISCTPLESHPICRVNLVLDSIYSYHEVQIMVTSGTATLEVLPSTVDLGMFKKKEVKTKDIALVNRGTMPIKYKIKMLGNSEKPFLPFTL